MQGTRVDRLKKIILFVLPFVVLGALIALDQISKVYFKNLYREKGNTDFINGFIGFTYTVNTGAAWSFLSGVSWAQTFFKILTVVSLGIFGVLYYYAVKKNYKWLTYTLVLIVGGTIGNFIDRLMFNGVTDFILLEFIDFPVFNLADSFLCVGVVMFIIHYLFLDGDAIFKKREKTTAETIESKLAKPSKDYAEVTDDQSAENNDGKEELSNN